VAWRGRYRKPAEIQVQGNARQNYAGHVPTLNAGLRPSLSSGARLGLQNRCARRVDGFCVGFHAREGCPFGRRVAHVFCNEQRRSPGLAMVSTMPSSGQSRPSQDEPPAHVTCPKCQNPKAVIAYTRHNELMCFCSGCAYGWDMLKPASGSSRFSPA
jgi:hypothetical protein